MGYGVNKFIANVDQNLICGICSAVLQEAVLTPCGHSFCLFCLETWLGRPGCNTCPECRSRVVKEDARPILSLRNLVNSMEVECDNKDRGCRAIMKLERLPQHLETCGYAPVECAGCNISVNRYELAGHQMQCEAIAASIIDDDDGNSPRSRQYRFIHDKPEVTALQCRVTSLELHLRKMKKDIELAEAKNRRLEKELKKTRDELEIKRSQLIDQQFVDFDPEYEYGYAPHTIARLSHLVSRFLLKRPAYIDRNRIYNSIKRCYDHYARCGDEYEHDVHMLVATAFASNWFTENQKTSFHCWLQSIARYRQYTHDLTMQPAASDAR